MKALAQGPLWMRAGTGLEEDGTSRAEGSHVRSARETTRRQSRSCSGTSGVEVVNKTPDLIETAVKGRPGKVN